MIKITYHGHACFTIESEGYSIVLDPYTKVEGFAELNLTANQVSCSHGHFDHNYVEAVSITPKDNSPFTITEIHTFHDPEQGKLRGENTIRIYEAGGTKIAHFGDLGCKLLPEQMELLKGLDVAMVPVGGFFTIDSNEAKALMDELNPRTIIPMHYKEGNRGIQMISEVSDFTKLYEGSNRVIANAKSAIVVNHGTEGQQSEGYSNLVVMELPEI